MAETIKGFGLRWGLGTFTVTATGFLADATSAMRTQSVELGFEAKLKVDVDANNGDTVARVYANQARTVGIEAHITADTIAHAKTSDVIPAPGTLVTVTAADDTQMSSAGLNTGKYTLESAKKVYSNKTVMVVRLELEALTNDITATISS